MSDSCLDKPMHAMGGILAGADVLLVHLKDDPLFRITIPSKTQAYMAAGKPIIMAVRGDAADLVKRSQSGVLCEPSAPQSIADAVKELADAGPEKLAAMGHNGSAFYDRELSVFIGANAFDRVFRAVWPNWPEVFDIARAAGGSGSRAYSNRGAALCGTDCSITLIHRCKRAAWLSMGRPIFFRQQRPGRFAKPFWLLKFRTMSDRRGAGGKLLPDADRLTQLDACCVRQVSTSCRSCGTCFAGTSAWWVQGRC